MSTATATSTGWVECVRDDVLITHLTAAVSAGATVLPVDAVGGFEVGQSVVVVDETVTVTAVDPDAFTLSVTALAAAHDDGDPVTGLTAGQETVERVADVSFGEGAGSVEALVPDNGVADRLPPGDYDLNRPGDSGGSGLCLYPVGTRRFRAA